MEEIIHACMYSIIECKNIEDQIYINTSCKFLGNCKTNLRTAIDDVFLIQSLFFLSDFHTNCNAQYILIYNCDDYESTL